MMPHHVNTLQYSNLLRFFVYNYTATSSSVQLYCKIIHNILILPKFIYTRFKRVSSISRHNPVWQCIPCVNHRIWKTKFSQVIFLTWDFWSLRSYASLSIQCHILHMLVGPVQKVDKNVSSESGQSSTGLWLPHSGMKLEHCGCICQQMDRLHEACCLQHCSRYPAILRGRIRKYKV